MVKNFNIYKLLQTFYNMTSIRGTVHDTVKRISFVLELEGPMATEVYVWQRDARYQSEPTILSDVPILMMKNTKEASLSNTGDVKECNTGHVVIGNLNVVIGNLGVRFSVQCERSVPSPSWWELGGNATLYGSQAAIRWEVGRRAHPRRSRRGCDRHGGASASTP